MGRVRNEGLWAQWRERVGRFERGPLSVVDFCAWEGVSVSAFRSWRRKLEREEETRLPSRRETRPAFVEVRLADLEAAAGDVLPEGDSEFSANECGSVVDAAGPDQIRITLPGGVLIEVPASSRSAIGAVIEMLVRESLAATGSSSVTVGTGRSSVTTEGAHS